MQTISTDVAIIGAGSVGIAVAYFLKQLKPGLEVMLIDSDQPMSLTSAASGENYRNWWPHPIMKQFMDRSIDLLEQLDTLANNEIIVSRSGYLLASRDAAAKDLLDNLQETFTESNSFRSHANDQSYRKSVQHYTDGVDLLQVPAAIQRSFPDFDAELKTVVHIRRGGSISTHSLGSYMLSQFRDHGGHLRKAKVTTITDNGSGFSIGTSAGSASGDVIKTESLVNAAGPFAPQLSELLGVELPVKNIYQQKIAFADTIAAVDRSQPFTIDLDSQYIDWTEDEREALIGALSDTQIDTHIDTGGSTKINAPPLARFTEEMPGSIHCRPDGGANSNRVKLGWAYNTTATTAISNDTSQSQTGLAHKFKEHRTIEHRSTEHGSIEHGLQDHFPEIVLRGAARLNPRLKHYYQGFPRDFTHYGGYYTMTEENWPLIGKTTLPGYFIATAMSGFGSMAACAAGELTALHVTGGPLPDYADALSLTRTENTDLMREISDLSSKGIL